MLRVRYHDYGYVRTAVRTNHVHFQVSNAIVERQHYLAIFLLDRISVTLGLFCDRSEGSYLQTWMHNFFLVPPFEKT